MSVHAIQNADDLYAYFENNRHDVEDFKPGRKRLYSGVLVNTKIRQSFLVDVRQGKITLNGRVREVIFNGLGGGVYRARIAQLPM
jgi:hypothetical protein